MSNFIREGQASHRYREELDNKKIVLFLFLNPKSELGGLDNWYLSFAKSAESTSK